VNSLVKTWPVIAARLIGKPVIWHVREYLGKKRMYARLIHLLATRVILISEEQFVLFQGLSKAVIIPNGIDLSLFEKVRPAVLPHDRNEDVRTVVTYVGTIEPRKGLFVLARAACLLGDLPWIHFVIVGEASRGNEAYKQKVVELVNSHGLEKRFHFLGQRKDIPEILAASDALCHPAFKEVFPRVILEAMASKIPVIAAGVGGITEMVRDGKEGFVVQSGDHSGFADAIRLIDSKKSLKVQMGKSCYGRVKREFTIQKHALKVAGLYKDILEESRAQGVQ
jgi:glycosyltransferase involved in cell wall biosynthesis